MNNSQGVFAKSSGTRYKRVVIYNFGSVEHHHLQLKYSWNNSTDIIDADRPYSIAVDNAMLHDAFVLEPNLKTSLHRKSCTPFNMHSILWNYVYLFYLHHVLFVLYYANS